MNKLEQCNPEVSVGGETGETETQGRAVNSPMALNNKPTQESESQYN